MELGREDIHGIVGVCGEPTVNHQAFALFNDL